MVIVVVAIMTRALLVVELKMNFTLKLISNTPYPFHPSLASLRLLRERQYLRGHLIT